jgi:transglutaminase-like putative cysteine protease
MSDLRPRPARAEVIDAAVAAAIPAGLAVATFLAATPWLRVFSVPGTVGVLVVAAIGSVSIPFLAVRVWHQPPAVSYAASAGGLAALLLGAAGLHPGAVGHALAAGPNRVLTETLPLGGGRALLAAPLVLTWLAGTGSAELVSRARRSDSGLAAVGLAIPVASFVLADAVAASRPGPGTVIAPLLLVTVAGVALLRHAASIAATPQAVPGSALEAEAGRSPWRAAVGGAVAVGVIAAALAVAVPVAPRLSGAPVALNRRPPLVTAVLDDPLDAFAALRDNNPHLPAHTVLQVRTAQSSDGYLAAVILDDYDGGNWSFDATLRPTGGRIPMLPDGAGAVGVVRVRQLDTLVAPLPVPFLPVLDRPTDVAGGQMEADAATGMLVPPALAPPASYTVVSEAPLPTLASVPTADGIGKAAGETLRGSGAVSPADVALPPSSAAAIATTVRFLAAITGRRPAPTVAFLQAALASLHADERRIDPAVPAAAGQPARAAPTSTPAPVRGSHSSGTSLSVVINTITNDHRGTPEQFATLYAAAARYLGVPARLATGFRLASTSSGGPVPAGDYQVTNRQAWTWVEIPVAGVGWVVADPTPDGVIGPGTPPPLPVQATPTTVTPNQANAVPRNQIAGAHAVAKPALIATPHPHAGAWWAVWLLALVGAGLLAVLLGPGLAAARRLLRRRARRGSDPTHLAVGAWLELLDALQQAGMVTGSGDTSGEVATEAGRHFGPDVTTPVHEVGAVADQAMFSVREPPDELAARGAWETQRAVRQAVHGRLDRRQRLRALLAVGSAPGTPERSPARSR